MTCPYSEAKCDASVAAGGRRCQCGRILKRCGACGVHNRAFASFCRSCGERLPPSQSSWIGSRGGARRLGFNPHPASAVPLLVKVPLALRLGSACVALLASDGHLIAIGHGGVVEIADVAAGGSVCRFQVQGPVTAEPCIRDGVLYLAAAKQLAAYSLAALTQPKPRVRAMWSVALSGTPIHALTPVGNRLYATVASPSWREVQVIENLAQPAPRSIAAAKHASWIAADESHAYFFSQNDGEPMQLHIAGPRLQTRAVALQPVPEHPVALIGGAIFGIFGEGHRLYRIDAATGSVEEALEEDAQFFALTASDAEWNRDTVVIDTGGIRFSRAGIRDAFGPYDRVVKGSPVIMSDAVAAVGMEDGRVRVYNLRQLPRHEVWVVDEGTAAISALASFDSYIAAGTRAGVVEVREIGARKGAPA